MTRDAFKAANRELIRLKFSLLGVKFATASITGLYLLSAQAITTGSNPYRGIIDRNVFSLKEIPPPPPPPGPDAGKPPPPPITLTGITTILGTKRAFMTLNIPGGKPGEAAKQESLMLTEGQRGIL